jgi:hypothetical protein
VQNGTPARPGGTQAGGVKNSDGFLRRTASMASRTISSSFVPNRACYEKYLNNNDLDRLPKTFAAGIQHQKSAFRSLLE